MPSPRKTGVPTGTIYMSPAKRKRAAAKRRREEASWVARSGPVTVTRMATEGEDQAETG